MSDHAKRPGRGLGTRTAPDDEGDADVPGLDEFELKAVGSDGDEALELLEVADAEPVRRGGGSTASRARVLVLDHGDGRGTAMAGQFSRHGYDVMVVQDGLAALCALELANRPGAASRFALLVCDAADGAERAPDFLARVLELDPTLRVLIGSRPGGMACGSGVADGVTHHLLQPLRSVDVVREMDELLGRRSTPAWQPAVAAAGAGVTPATPACESEQATLRQLSLQVAETLITAMEAKNTFLRGHSRRIGALAADVAEHLGLEADLVEQVRLAGRLHDVGKIGVREEVLNKVAPLTPEEFAHIQTHVAIGVEILAPLRHMGPALTFIADHHERWDGTGYPAGLAGEAISLGGRIVAAADAFDALTSERPYRAALSKADAIALLETLVGRLLDPRVFAALKVVALRNSTLVFLDEQ